MEMPNNLDLIRDFLFLGLGVGFVIGIVLVDGCCEALRGEKRVPSSEIQNSG